MDNALIRKAIDSTLTKINVNLNLFTDRFPGTATTGGVYRLRTAAGENPTPAMMGEGANFDWTTGFWTGMLWLAYEITGSGKYRNAAETQVESFRQRLDNRIDVDTHDLGFLYTLSCVAAYKLTGSESARETALQAADLLMNRYFEKAGIIQAHGDLNDPMLRGRIIIDCLMNLPLLYWASEMTGKARYRNAARNHAYRSLSCQVRADASTHHTYYFDTETGSALYGETLQGASDQSCWARGQAWGIYGSMLSYAYLKEQYFIDKARELADYFLLHCPADHVAYWDLIYTDGSGEPRDSSASAIAVCGLMELVKWLPEGDVKRHYNRAAEQMLTSLIENYATIRHPASNALLLHGTYFKQRGWGVDEGLLFGDYFYLEALVRAAHEWKPYW